MSRIGNIFTSPGYKALVAYLTVGYPDLDTTLRAAGVLAASGCDLIELGIPFSDPLADGATIQRASYRALQNGVTPGVCLNAARALSRCVDTPLAFMTYLNPVLRYGCDAFARECREAGVSGIIVPDLPPDQDSGLRDAAEREGLDMVYLLAPNSPEERIRLVARHTRGFIYLVSLTGVTGTRTALSGEVAAFASRVRAATAAPLCVGFGISTPEQARQMARSADGVIIGSRLIQLIEKDPSLASLAQFVREVRGALDEQAEAAPKG